MRLLKNKCNLRHILGFLFSVMIPQLSYELSYAQLKIVATMADIGSIVRAVGEKDVEVKVLAKGTQDPHYLEPKPSYMVSLRDADLLVANGLSLEVGWLPSLIRGARNSKVLPGQSGYLELGSLIQPIDLPVGKISRSMGDIHPDGNPHFTLDPIRIGEIAIKLGMHLAKLDPKNAESYKRRATEFQGLFAKRSGEWKARITKTGLTQVITHHPSLNYFLDRFGLRAAAYLEPKPGIPPTAQHILQVIDLMKEQKVRLILVDSFFDSKIADRVAKEVQGSKVKVVGVSVESEPALKNNFDVMEQIVKAIEDGAHG